MPLSNFAFLDHEGPIAFAHRGGIDLPANVGIENTIRAFQNAVDLGFRYLETDVHVTTDGIPVVFHDHTLNRVTDHQGPIASLSFEQLQKVRVGGREPIPTLEETLETFPDAMFNIDVKVAPVIEPAAKVIKQMNATDRVCISAFSGKRLRMARKALGPSVATGLEPAGVAIRALGLPNFLATLLRADAPCIQVPPASGRLKIVTTRLIEHAHAQGKQVHVWTIDTKDEIHQLLDLGVDGIMTDRPDILRDAFEERGLWPAA